MNHQPPAMNPGDTNPPRYYAIIAPDGDGPAWGIGHTPSGACSDCLQWGFDPAGGRVIEITAASYAAIEEGNPDAWKAVAG